jgi:hypothetical protein
MLKAGEIITAFFENNSVFAATMGQKIFPLFALAGTAFPFTTYRINFQTPITKDGMDRFDCTVFFWFSEEGYRAACDFHDAILPSVRNNNDFRYVNSTVEFSEEDKSVYTSINFLID